MPASKQLFIMKK